MNFSEKRADQLALAFMVVLLILGVFLLTLVFDDSDLGYQPSITVNGEGRAFAVADTATFNYTVTAEAATADEAQTEVSKAAKAIKDALLAEGVEAKDIKTENYNVYPRYEYRTTGSGVSSSGTTEAFLVEPDFRGGQTRVLVGYEATQTNSVRVRETDQAGSLLSLATENGADNVSNLNFVVWDESAVEAEAREEAIKEAKTKAQELADQLGVSLGDIIGFDEFDQGYYPAARMESFSMSADEDMGGKVAEISLGENEIRRTVNITYEIK